jgi:hypothetical protein
VSGDDRALDAERVHDGDHVGRHLVGVVARLGLAGVAVAAGGDRDRADRVGQRREHGLVGAVGVGDAVEQDDRDAVGVALLEVGDQQAAVDLDGLRGVGWGHATRDAATAAAFPGVPIVTLRRRGRRSRS